MISGREAERQLILALSSASDDALARVVALVDALPDRGTADRLLDRVRPRLRRLRPARPLGLPRLLFLPLDGAIEPAATWRRDPGRLPRSALMPLADRLRAAAPDGLEEILAEAARHRTSDSLAVGRLGRQLWALAAASLPATPGQGWEAATGLAAADYTALARLCVGVWRCAGSLWEAVESGPAGPPDALLRTALQEAAAEPDPAVFAACLDTLLLHAAHPGRVATFAAGLGPAARQAVERGLIRRLDGSRLRFDPADPGGTACEVARLATALADLDGAGPCQGADWRSRIARARREAALRCGETFDSSLRTLLLEPVGLLAGSASDDDVERLEATARDLRRLEAAGRRLGEARSYDTAAGRTVAGLLAARDAAQPGGLTRMDLARLAEILCGRQVALRVLGEPVTAMGESSGLG